MNANPWAAPKCREIRRVLVSLDERIAQACELVPDEGSDPQIVHCAMPNSTNCAPMFICMASAAAPTGFSTNTRILCPAS